MTTLVSVTRELGEVLALTARIIKDTDSPCDAHDALRAELCQRLDMRLIAEDHRLALADLLAKELLDLRTVLDVDYHTALAIQRRVKLRFAELLREYVKQAEDEANRRLWDLLGQP